MCQGHLSAATLITASLIYGLSKAIILQVVELIPLLFCISYRIKERLEKGKMFLYCSPLFQKYST